MEVHTVTIVGSRPLIMHNGRLKDPLDPWTKKLSVATHKKKKSEEDHGEIARIEYEGGMYLDKRLGPYLPTDNLQACLIEGARKRKLGKQFEALVEVVPLIESEGYALEYDGPRDVESLWKDPRFVFRKDAKVGMSAVMRTRPRFPAGWRCAFDIEVLDGGATSAELEQALTDAGMLVGIGDWSPRYGRFTVDKIAQKKRATEGLGEAGPGCACQGEAWQGMAGLGKARSRREVTLVGGTD